MSRSSAHWWGRCWCATPAPSSRRAGSHGSPAARSWWRSGCTNRAPGPTPAAPRWRPDRSAVGRGFIDFTRTWISEENLLGELGTGFTQVMQGFDFSRALIGLQVIGAAQVTLDETWEYTGTRTAFDQPLSTFQGVAFPLAEA